MTTAASEAMPRAGAPTRASGLVGLLEGRAALLVVVALGIAARVVEYAARHALSGDEAFLALNLVHRSYGELFEQLDWNQVAPPLLLVLEKATIDVLGTTEVAVRLVPFLAGIATVVLFPFLALRLLPRRAVLPAVAIVAFVQPLVLWSATNKQYAVDALATVVILLAATAARSSRARLLGLTAVGAVALWFSFSAAFSLAGVGALIVFEGLRERRAARACAAVAAMGAAWIATLWVAMRFSGDGVRELQGSWNKLPGAYVGSSDSPLSTVVDTVRSVSGTLRYLTGVPRLEVGGADLGEVLVVVCLLFALVGLVSAARSRPQAAVLLGVPPLTAFVASAAHQYPLYPRTSLWAMPILALLFGEGVRAACGSAKRPVAWAAAMLATLTVVAVAAATAAHLVERPGTQEMRPVLEELVSAIRPGDRIYANHRTQYGLRWYLECDCASDEVRDAVRSGLIPLLPVEGSSPQWAPALRSSPPRLIIGRAEGPTSGNEIPDDIAEVDRLAPGRTWVLISNVPDEARAAVLGALDRRGTRLATIVGNGDEGVAGAYLYALRNAR